MHRIGLDIGSTFCKLVLFDGEHKLLEDQVPTLGVPGVALEKLLSRLDISPGNPVQLGICGVGKDLFAGSWKSCHVSDVAATAAGVRLEKPEIRTIFDMRGGFSRVIQLSEDGSIADFSMNGQCAAGAGAFLEQQAGRLMMDVEQLGNLAEGAKQGAVIAGRCSVFAKSDMIHLQQKGTPVDEMAYGLCLALVRTFAASVLAGRQVVCPVAILGGGAKNAGILRAFSEVFSWDDEALWVPGNPMGVLATGAALLASGKPVPMSDVLKAVRQGDGKAKTQADSDYVLAPLGPYPPVVAMEPPRDPASFTRAVLGVDVGSVSTNLVLMTPDGTILDSQYLATRGQPLAVLQEGLAHLRDRFDGRVEIIGCATTGSGRHLAAAVLGADLVKNEITAQMTAAVLACPDVDTIFEIGGQDSKYIRVENRTMADFTMNKICAAGTGSFLEEEAQRLGVRIIGEFAELAQESSAPVDLGSQCTVFMDTELVHAQRRGAGVPDLCAGLAYSVVRNYLEKVVSNRPVGEHIVFQGGTASNQAVVSAFEKVLGRPVRVHPYNRVSGAVGMAHLVSLNLPESTRFKGFSHDFEPKVSTFECPACTNRCSVSRFSFGEENTFFGDACEKFSNRKKTVRTDSPGMKNLVAIRQEMWQEREEKILAECDGKKRIGLVSASVFREFAPFFARILQKLGFTPKVAPEEHVRSWVKGARGLPPDLCIPLKMAAGQVKWLLEEEGVEQVLYPALMELPKRQSQNTTIRNLGSHENSHTCIYTQEVPFMVARVWPTGKVLTPQFPLSFESTAVHAACGELASVLGVDLHAVKDAWTVAEAEHRENLGQRASIGSGMLRAAARPALVLLGKPYTMHDSYLNMGLARHLERMGFDVLPMDFLPLDDVELGPEYERLPWGFSRDLIRAAMLIERHPHVFPVFISNFGCGPDGFVQKHVESILRHRPKLLLEFDELRGEAGMVTRIEAFCDGIEAHLKQGETTRLKAPKFTRHVRVNINKIKRVFLPYLGPHNAVFEGMLKSLGHLEIIQLPPPSHAVMRKGEEITNGKECHPYACIAGDILNLIESHELSCSDALYMPSTLTPCLLSQYGDGYRLYLQEKKIPLQILDVIGHDQWDLYGFDGLRRLMDGFFAVDTLMVLRYRLRPYEKTPGKVDAIFAKALDGITRALAEKQSTIGPFAEAVSAFRGMALDRTTPRPLVGFTGDLYTRLCEPASDHLVDRLEEAGCEVYHSPYMYGMIWFSNYFDAYRQARRSQVGPTMYEMLAIMATEGARRPFEEVLGSDLGPLCLEPDYEQCMNMVLPYVGRNTNFLVSSILAKMVHFARQKVEGVISVVATGCMVGCAVNSAVEDLSRDYPGVAMLPLVVGTERNLAHVRLETFLHQVRESLAQRQATKSGVRIGGL